LKRFNKWFYSLMDTINFPSPLITRW
jgi:hypothetical protein